VELESITGVGSSLNTAVIFNAIGAAQNLRANLEGGI